MENYDLPRLEGEQHMDEEEYSCVRILTMQIPFTNFAYAYDVEKHKEEFIRAYVLVS